MKKFLPIIFKILLIIAAITGIYLTIFSNGFMSQSAFLYFTIQSNIWILCIFIVFLIFNIIELVKGKDLIPNWLRTIKFIFTTAITLTFIVFAVLLSPQFIIEGNAQYLTTLSNLCVHNIVPILAIIDWCLFDYKYKTKKGSFVWGITMPLYYCIFALIASTTTLDFGGGSHFPYFFFNYEYNTWFQIGNGKFGTFYWIVLLIGLVFAISWVLILIKNKIEKRKNNNLVK